ncbi:MAG: leukotoxin LktA family filamentous adhesin, partial [Spirochaetales bacterium]
MNKLKKVIASILCLNILLSSSPVMLFAADTTNITGVTGDNGVYNITAQEVVSGTGYRQYTDFTLANSDIANLIFTKDNADFSRFINMVDNKVEINGLLNTVDGSGAFYNGHAIFVTPSGMVIGKDGILNVGKLSLISTTNSAYNSYVQNHSDSNYTSLITNASGDIIINGRVLTSVPGANEKAAEIHAGNITVERKATDPDNLTYDSVGIAANTDTTDVRIYSSASAATEKFNSLVNAQVKSATNAEFDTQGNVILSNAKLDASGSVKVNNEVAFKATEFRFFGGFEIKDLKLFDFGTQTVLREDLRNVSDTILLDNSSISGKNVDVSAVSTAYGQTELADGTGATWSIIWDLLEHGLTSASELLNNITFNYFSGARSLSEVAINNSEISATKDLNVGTKANATFNLDQKPGEVELKVIKDFLFTFGTQTKSKVTIENSNLYSEGKTNITAESYNSFGKKEDLFD